MSNYDKRLLLAATVLICTFGYLFGITFIESAKPNDIITGSLLTSSLATILSFYYGSSDKKGKDGVDKP